MPQTQVVALIRALGQLLAPLSPLTKAVVPAVSGVLVAVVDSAFKGSVDVASLSYAAFGLMVAVTVYFAKNKGAAK